MNYARIEKTNSPKRKSANLSIDEALLKSAKDLGLNISRAAEEGLLEAVNKAKSARWQIENQSALDSFNTYIEENGLPLERHRKF